MGKGKNTKPTTRRGEILDLRAQIREMLKSSSETDPRDENESVTYFMLPGRWSVAEFRDLLAAAA